MFTHFNNGYWVLGGFTPEPQSDVWRSTDGGAFSSRDAST
jgi:hypothetical protein